MMARQGSPVQDPSCHDIPIPLRNHLTLPGVGAVAPGDSPTGTASGQSLGGQPEAFVRLSLPRPSRLGNGGISKAHASDGKGGDRWRPSPGLPGLQAHTHVLGWEASL